MPIEFNCPHCNAIIRVADNAAGGRGKCPKCTARIKVPKVSMPRVTKPAEPEPELEPFMAPGGHDAADEFGAVDSGHAAAAPDFPEPAVAPSPGGLDAIPVEAPRHVVRTTAAVAYKLKKRRNSIPWPVPVGIGVILCVAVGLFLWKQQADQKLAGELTAESAAALELKPVELSPSSFKNAPDDIKKILDALQKSPVKLPSPLMNVQIGASKTRVTVTVNAGTQTQFYRVDVQQDAAMKKFRSESGTELDEARTLEVERTGGEFLREYQRVLDKEAKANVLNDFRDSLALPALVRGLGHQVVAARGGKTYRCVYEDNDGALYFLLPPDTQEFEIVGRKIKDKINFPGRYLVLVSGEMKQPVKETKEDKSKKNPSDSKEEMPGMSESKDEADMKDMKKETDGDEMQMDEKPMKKKK